MFERLSRFTWPKSLRLEVLVMVGLFVIAPFVLPGGGEDKWPLYLQLLPIFVLLAVVAVFFYRLPKPTEDVPGQLAHLEWEGYKRRRTINWLIIGVAYALFYWARYNVNSALLALGGGDMVTTFHLVFGVGTWVYGISFLVNGPLTDRRGGRFAMIYGIVGVVAANIMIGFTFLTFQNGVIGERAFMWSLVIFYSVNMYFQSCGAVAIVKINAPWFHVRERGVFGSIFGILIALGLFLAYDLSDIVLDVFTKKPEVIEGIEQAVHSPIHLIFFIPAIILAIVLVATVLFVKNRPSQAGFKDFRTGDASEDDKSQVSDPPIKVFKMMMGSTVIVTVAYIEFCSGFLRQAIMQNYKFFAKSMDIADLAIYKNWGLLLCMAGIIGGIFAGVISDRLFKSERGPVAAVLYAGMLAGSIVLCLILDVSTFWVGIVAILMSMCVIGVHGMLSGTFTQDIGGTKNVGIVTGLIDGCVYAGTGVMSLLYAFVLPEKGSAAAQDIANWKVWPALMVFVAITGMVLSFIIRHARRDLEAQKKAKREAEAVGH